MSGVAGVYGQALYDLAREEGLTDGFLSELKILKTLFQENAAYVRLLNSHSLSLEERLGIIHEGFAGRVHPYVLNFMKILTEKGYIRHFITCCDVFQESYNIDHNILPVKVTTAWPLPEEPASRLRAKLSGISGHQIELENIVDPDCMGGIRLDYDGKRVDDTVQHRLDAVRALLKNTIL